MDRILFSSFAVERDPKLQICTQIIERDGKKAVRKTALNENGIPHIHRLREYEARLEKTYAGNSFLQVCPISDQGEDWVEFSYQEGETLEKWLIRRVNQGDVPGIRNMLSAFWDGLLKMGNGIFQAGAEFRKVFGDEYPKKELHGSDHQNIDLIFTNLFRVGDTPDSFAVSDYEWFFDFPVPLEYIYYRSIFCSVALSRLKEAEREELYRIAGIEPEDLDAYLKTEIAFQRYITGDTKTMAEHYRRMGQECLLPASSRDPYEIRILEGEKLLDSRKTARAENELDLSGYGAADIAVQLGYPYSVIRLPSDDLEGWECRNAAYGNRDLFFAGGEPLIFHRREKARPVLHYRIADVDEYDFQHTIRDHIMQYGDRIGELETELRGKGDQVGELEKQLRNKDDEIGALETQLRSKGDEVGELEKQLRSKGDQVGELEKQLRSKGDQVGELEKQLTIVAPNLKSGAALEFAHGFAITYGLIVPPKDVDVIMMAPKSPGASERKAFEDGFGVPALFCVHQDASGKARDIAMALCKGLGSTRAGIFEIDNFDIETKTDLFGEQAVECGGLSKLIEAGFKTLVDAGYPAEVAYFETCHECKLIIDLIVTRGMGGMWRACSNTAKYGGLTRRDLVVTDQGVENMKEILRMIESGEFKTEWRAEWANGLKKLHGMMDEEDKLLLEKTGAEVRSLFQFKDPKQ